MEQRWKLTIEYKGTDYAGWQRQDNVPSIQQAVEEALHKFCQKDIRIHAAGRTDSGVHAQGQIAHFDLDYEDRSLDGFSLAKAINAHLYPQPISIVKARKTAPDFHARFDARNKLYTYRIISRPGMLALDKDFTWHIRRPLNIEAMQEAATVLLGCHDFTTFRDSKCQAKSPKKTLDSLDIEARNYDDYGGQEILFHVQARSFLHHQVRNIVGTLSLVGQGKWTKEDVAHALKSKDRTKGGPTAPAHGLYLIHVRYSDSYS